MVVQLIQNLVWILLSGESMDPLKPFERIWMGVQLATNTVQMVSPCVYKTNRYFWKWKFWMVSNGLSAGGFTGENGKGNWGKILHFIEHIICTGGGGGEWGVIGRTLTQRTRRKMFIELTAPTCASFLIRLLRSLTRKMIFTLCSSTVKSLETMNNFDFSVSKMPILPMLYLGGARLI